MPLICVRFSDKLRERTNDLQRLEINADTIFDLVNQLEITFPNFKSSTYLPNNQLRPFFRIFHNGRDISERISKEVLLSAADEVHFVQAISGG
jgi:molybdopterin converting factor small subunit